MRFCLGWSLVAWLANFTMAYADVVQVRDAANLKTVLSSLAAGTVLHLAPGEYPGALAIKDVVNRTPTTTGVRRAVISVSFRFAQNSETY